jgi:hypothetical protein
VKRTTKRSNQSVRRTKTRTSNQPVKEQRPRGHICEKKKDHEIKSMRRTKTSVSCSLIVDFGVSTSAIIFMKQVLGD